MKTDDLQLPPASRPPRSRVESRWPQNIFWLFGGLAATGLVILCGAAVLVVRSVTDGNPIDPLGTTKTNGAFVPHVVGPLDTDLDTINFRTVPATIERFTWRVPEEFAVLNSTEQKRTYVRNASILDDKSLIEFSVYRVTRSLETEFDETWYSTIKGRLKGKGYEVLSMDEGTLMGHRCFRAKFEVNGLFQKLHGILYEAACDGVFFHTEFSTTFPPGSKDYAQLELLACSIQENYR